jgi:hypothetical protein
MTIISASLLALVAYPSATASARATARKPSKGPTAAEVRAAVARAARSRDLWATINICNTPRNPAKIGIRGQMPALGFTSRLYMDVRIEYWSGSDKRFKPTNARQLIALGRTARAVHQSGAIFPFNPGAGILRGVITFQWRLGRKVIGKVVRRTGHGYQHVDFGDPPGYSAGLCTIP